MRLRTPKIALFAVASVSILANTRPVAAQLFASMNFSQGVTASAPHEDSAQYVVSMTVPIQQTATANTSYGGTVTAIYSVTDNGTTATLDINSTGS